MNMLDGILKIAATALIGTGVAGIVAWIKYLHGQNKATKKALRAVVHDSHHRMCRALMQKDAITEDELENLNFLHDAYTGLGMNGTGETLYNQAKSKPLKTGVQK